MDISRRQLLETGATFCAAAAVLSSSAAAQGAYVPFQGEKTAWHDGFDRYDFIMDDATGAISPMTAPASEVTSFGIDEAVKDGKRRGVVVVPRKARRPAIPGRGKAATGITSLNPKPSC